MQYDIHYNAHVILVSLDDVLRCIMYVDLIHVRAVINSDIMCSKFCLIPVDPAYIRPWSIHRLHTDAIRFVRGGMWHFKAKVAKSKTK